MIIIDNWYSKEYLSGAGEEMVIGAGCSWAVEMYSKRIYLEVLDLPHAALLAADGGGDLADRDVSPGVPSSTPSLDRLIDR